MPYLCFAVRRPHYLTLLATLSLTAVLYWGFSTVPPKKAGAVADGMPHANGAEHAPMQGPLAVPATSAEILADARTGLPVHGAMQIDTLTSVIAATRDSTQMAPLFRQLARLWASHRQGAAAGHYLALEARLEKSPEKLNFAGRFFLNLLATQADSPAVRAWEGQNAVALFEQAQAMAPSDSTKMDLAAAYIDGAGETMKGVQMLLGIVRENPSNVPAALMLGKMAIESGQWDKAVTRFEAVLEIDPNNREALYFLAESYKGSGNRAKAIETFERVKKVVGNPDFNRDIDAYLKTF